MRIGHGYDVHRFSDEERVDNPLMLGGVEIPHDRGVIAHSDGDVVIHALCDAVLGALAAGDIGRRFPDSSEEFRNIDSTVLLRRVMQLALAGRWQVVNADITVVAEKPKLAPWMQPMCERLGELLAVADDRINVKATTTEGLGFPGRKEGIACYAVVLLGRDD
ncbi:MAG: 2-C-methyl-D-erythritol 2,4-cyclodiphosphate synthase [Pseudohongiellaceae bacterium]